MTRLVPYKISSLTNYISIENYPGLTINFTDNILGSDIFPKFRISFVDEEGFFLENFKFYLGLPVNLSIKFSEVVNLEDIAYAKLNLDLDKNLIVESINIPQTNLKEDSNIMFFNVDLVPDTKYIDLGKASPSKLDPTSSEGGLKENLLSYFKSLADKYVSELNTLFIDPKLASKFLVLNKIGFYDFEYIKEICKKLTDKDFYVAFMNYRGDLFISSINTLIKKNSVKKKTLRLSKSSIEKGNGFFYSLGLNFNRKVFDFIETISELNSEENIRYIKLALEDLNLFPTIPNLSGDTPFFGFYLDNPNKSIASIAVNSFTKYNGIDPFWKGFTVGIFMDLDPSIKAGDVVELDIPKPTRFRKLPIDASILSGEYIVLKSSHSIEYRDNSPNTNTALILSRTSYYSSIKDNLIKMNLL